MKKRFNEGSIGLAVAVVAAFTGLASACGSKGSSTTGGSDSKTESKSSGGSASGSKMADCAFQKDPNNCWRKFVDSVKTCVGSEELDQGVLAADNKSCKHKSREIAFAKPPVPAEKGKKDIDFTVKVGGKECLHWTETGQGLDLDSKDMKTDFTMTGTSPFGKVTIHKKDFDWTLTCPDGSVWENSLEKVMSKALAGDTASVDCAEADSMNPNAMGIWMKDMASFELGIQTLDLKGLKIFDCMKAG